ncbi:MAG: Gfo/Idh/MocA family oxidoreductase [Planctomycetes bacterium]|nr:Gfo/Idh/MocA family oxidoreductase [Planctomycetota bacterium]
MDLPNVLMIGTGEYTTGYVHDRASPSDKSAGVVALTFFDLRRRGKVGRLSLAGTNGKKFPGVRQHFQQWIAERYKDMDVQFESFPSDDVPRDPGAYRQALDTMRPGDLVTVFTPDDTHFRIALDAIRRGCHVLVAKPIVKTIEEHRRLAQAAREQNVLAAMEVHKRWDPIYTDARDRIRDLGEFSHFASYMSQPKSQLETFRHWAGRSSDISYYLNAHHIDFTVWALGHMARPVQVWGLAATGLAVSRGLDTEDTITVCCQWENRPSGNRATALYTASWIAPKSDVHSQQRFFYMGHRGELEVDQAHRGYSQADDASGFQSLNPLFMKYTPDAQGYFAGQLGYGYRSIEAFVDAVTAIRSGDASPADFAGRLATVDETLLVTAILEAGRRSLDGGGRPYQILYDAHGNCVGLREG